MGNGSTLYALILAIVLAGWTLAIWQARILRRAPVALHNLAWIVALGVYGSNIVHFTSVTAYAWAVLTLGIGVFNGVVIFGSHPNPASEGRDRPKPLVSQGEYRILIVLYTIGFGYLLHKISGTFGLHTLLHNSSEVRAQAGDLSLPFPVKLLFYLGPLLVVLTLNRWAVGRDRRTTRGRALFWQVVTLAYLVISMFADVQRTILFTAALWEIALVIIYPSLAASTIAAARRTRRRRNVAVLVLLLAAFGAFQFLAVSLNKTEADASAVQPALSSRLQGSQYASVPIYVAGGIAAFSQLIESTNYQAPPAGVPAPQIIGDYNPETWGRDTFQAVLKVVPVFPAWNSVAPYAQIPFPGNVYTWYEPYYRDFRVPGVVILTALSAMAVTYAHNRKRRSSAWMFLAALLIGYTALAPFANRFSEVFTAEYVILLLWFGRRRLERPQTASLRPPPSRQMPLWDRHEPQAGAELAISKMNK